MSKSRKKDDVHPLVLVVIGSVVAIASLAINIAQDSNFVVFMIAGLIMASYGLVKYVILGKNDEMTQISGVQDNQNLAASAYTGSARNPSAEKGFQQAPPNFCSRCGFRMAMRPNFCPNCGLRLR